MRARLGHPVVDADGHLLEGGTFRYLNAEQVEALTAFMSTPAHQLLSMVGDGALGLPRSGWWGTPANAVDLASVMAPRLLAERLEAMGIDYAVLYPSGGLGFVGLPDDSLRRATCRAVNTGLAESCADVSHRLTPAAAIPMHTPEEAIAELEHAVDELGMKVAWIPPLVARPLAAYPQAFPAACRLDYYAIDSDYDYDPVWQAFLDRGLAVTSHGAVSMRYMPCGRFSPTNYVFNHIGGHAYQQGELVKTLVMGGVPMRFPTLHFGFLECGVGWAPDLLHHLAEHWEKRGGPHVGELDPDHVDAHVLAKLLADYGAGDGAGLRSGGAFGVGDLSMVRDEFEAAGIGDETEFAPVFARQFFFGCEADDPSIYRAFHARGNPHQTRLQPVFSSDMGHWDVPDMGRVLLESHALVDDGLLSDQDYRDLVFTNPVRLHAGMNPTFFDGTAVADAARSLLGADTAAPTHRQAMRS